MRGYFALLFAVGLEVFGTLSLKFASLGQLPLGWLLTALCIAGSYVLLSVSFRRIPVAVAFAVWEAAGLALVTLLGFVLLHEALTPLKVAALLGLGAGAFLLHRGTQAPESAA
ncbi:DMT family transporter [Deinococcus fonticola]|uniref:DMT family transporter n=1 Tax=Deinococcus fonticola TaxID=2528713 RepID=UPI001075373F|nr:SMR family transporter [Deinococcus fonticola]